MPVIYIANFLNVLFGLLSFAILVRVLLSWNPMYLRSRIGEILIEITDPILNLAKRISPNLGMIDISPIIAVVGLDLIRALIFKILGFA